MKLRNRRALAVALAVVVTATSVIAQTTPPPAPPALQPPPVATPPAPVAPPVVTPPPAPVAAPAPAATSTNAPAKAAKKKSAPKKSDSKTTKSAKKEAPAKKEPSGPAISATVKQPRVNLRGQPSLTGEVITQVHKGEKVTILEEIPGKKGKAGEPAVWARISMPTNTPVWVSSIYVDTASSTVKSKKLNLRAGPGENYSVVGELKQGAAIKQIRQNDSWIEIEAPANAYAFVALDLLEKGEPIVVVAKASKPAKPAADKGSKSGKATLAASTPLTTTEVTTETPPVAPGTKVAKMEPIKPAEPVKPKVESAPAPVVAEAVTAPIVVPKAPKRRFYESTAGPRRGNSMETDRPLYQTIGQFDPNAPPVRRNVRREGVVNSTMFYSVQTPTYYQLVGEDSGEVLDFLYPSDPSMKLSAMTGARVIVTGEEYLDPRWPKTPVLKIDTLEVVPDAAR